MRHVSKETLVMSPPDMLGDRTRKGRNQVVGPMIIPLVLESRILRWDGDTAMLALTEIRNKKNYHTVPRDRFRQYNTSIQLAAKHKSPDEMRRVVNEFPDCVIQAREMIDVPDEILIRAAMYMTEAID